MARRRFRHNQNRNDSLTERSYQEFVYNLPAPQISRTELIRMIRGGEDTYFELKVKLSNSEKITQGIIALANTDGGMFVFGVNDQLRIEGVDYPETVRDELMRICREEIYPPIVPLIDMIAFDNSKRIVVLEVIGKKRPYRNKEGRFFMRFGAEKREVTREELSSWLDEIRPLRYENIPLIGATEQDIDDAMLWTFAKHFEDEIDSKFSWQTGEFLRKDLLLAIGDNESVTPTIAAVLLFGKNEKVAEFLPRSVIHVTRYTGENGNAQVVEKIELKGNLSSLYEQSLKFIKNYCDLTKEKPNVKKTQNSPIASRGIYHRDSIREAIANMLIHRDLVIRDITSRINIYDNSIEFINPRRTNGFVPPASRAIRYGLTQRLNPQITTIFQSPAYEIFYGSLPKLLKDVHDFSSKRPELLTSNDEFKLKIYSA
jgi:ATP-dependent DNA helicase RecG